MGCSVNIGTSLCTYLNAACRCMLQVMLYLVVGLHHLVLVPMPVQHSHHPLWETIISVNVDAREDPLWDGDGNPYVDGLSITYDTPRRHLWTYAAGYSDSGSLGAANCPCASYSGALPPSFVGDHYFCESGNVGEAEDQWYADDPLWDGAGCPTNNTCCDPPVLPWFNRMIDEPSTVDIELRLCRDEAATNEDLSVELFELYVY